MATPLCSEFKTAPTICVITVTKNDCDHVGGSLDVLTFSSKMCLVLTDKLLRLNQEKLVVTVTELERGSGGKT